MNKLFFLILLLAISSQLLAQETGTTVNYKIGVSGGFGLIFPGDLKEINTEVINSSQFDLSVVNNFPPRPVYGGYILNSFGKRIAFGPSYFYFSTGSRLGIKDYSGSYAFDQIVSAHSLGIQFEFLLDEREKSNWYLEFTGGINLATWSIKEKLTIDGEKESDLTKLKATRPFIYPGVKYIYPLTKMLNFTVRAGVSVDLAGKYSFEGNPDYETDSKASFTGPRILVGLEYGY